MTVPAAAGAEMTAIEMRECSGSQETPSPHFSSFPTQLPAPGKEGAEQDAFLVMEEARRPASSFFSPVSGPEGEDGSLVQGEQGGSAGPGPRLDQVLNDGRPRSPCESLEPRQRHV